MTRRVPIIPTIVVLAAVATMIALGVWQLGRKSEKEALIARYQAALNSDVEVAFQNAPMLAERILYRRSRLECLVVSGVTTQSGRSGNGQTGLAHFAQCQTSDGGIATVVLGWSRDLASPGWAGGEVKGWIAPGPRLIADPPVAGLQPNAAPDPGDLPNNHLAYAGQWFFFALTALVIYVLALRRRRR